MESRACTFSPGTFKCAVARRVFLGHQPMLSPLSVRSDGTRQFHVIPLPGLPSHARMPRNEDGHSVAGNRRDLVGFGAWLPQLWATISSLAATNLPGWLFASGYCCRTSFSTWLGYFFQFPPYVCSLAIGPSPCLSQLYTSFALLLLYALSFLDIHVQAALFLLQNG